MAISSLQKINRIDLFDLKRQLDLFALIAILLPPATWFLLTCFEFEFRNCVSPEATADRHFGSGLCQLYKQWEPITEQHSVCKNTLNLFQFQYPFSYSFGYGRSSITIFHIYILFIAKRVVGHYGKLISVKIQ